MADSFEGGEHIRLQPDDANIVLRMRFPVATASTLNDGAMPYGSTLRSATLTCHHEAGTSSSTQLIAAVTYSSQVVTAYLTYSSSVDDGIYNLVAHVNMSLYNSTLIMTKQFDFDRLYVGDI